MNIKIEYDGQYPNLCSGNLVVTVNGVRHVFPDHCLCSGGNVSFDENLEEEVTHGPWTVREWPASLPIEQRRAVLAAINQVIRHGCCGGCV